MISPFAASSASCVRALAREIPIASAISESSLSPFFFKNSRISLLISFLAQVA